MKNLDDQFLDSRTVEITAFSRTRSGMLVNMVGDHTVDLDAIAKTSDEDVSTAIDTDLPDIGSFSLLSEHYVIGAEIASGINSVIRRAFDKRLGREVAVKSLNLPLCTRPGPRDDFLIESKITSQLDHPAIAPVYDVCRDDDGGLHLVTKLFKGKKLDAYLNRLVMLYEFVPHNHMARSEARSLHRRIDIFLGVCDAVIYAHHHDVIHRNLNPENIMLGKYNEICVMGWSMAELRLVDGEYRPRFHLHDYAAPELLSGRDYDLRSDVYSLGLVLFEMVFLHRAFDQENPSQSHGLDTVKFVHKFKYSVPSDLKKIIRKSIDPDPDKRYNNLHELAEDLHHWESDERISAGRESLFGRVRRAFSRRRKWISLSAIVLTAILICGIFFAMYNDARKRAYNNKRNMRMNIAQEKVMRTGMKISKFCYLISSSITALADECSARMEAGGGGIATVPAKLYTREAALKDRYMPLDIMPFPGYRNLMMSLSEFSYVTKRDTDSVELALLHRRIAPLKNNMLRALLSSMRPEPGMPGSVSELKKLKKKIVMEGAPLQNVYIGFNNGIHINYPYLLDFDDDFDPRTRSWYLAARNLSRGSHVWSEPYNDTGEYDAPVVSCAVPVISQSGELLGVAGGDISVAHILSLLLRSGNDATVARRKFLMDESGVILIDDSINAREQVTTDVRFEDGELLRRMWHGGTGAVFDDHHPGMLYIYCKVDDPGLLYVELIDFAELMKD